jgi:hypothetical protein
MNTITALTLEQKIVSALTDDTITSREISAAFRRQPKTLS